MKRLILAGLFLSVVLSAGILSKKEVVAAGGGWIPAGNGDVNGDRSIDIGDPVYLLSSLFLEGPGPVPIECPSMAGRTLPRTGQTKCYDGLGGEIDCRSADFPDQDGYVQSGCPGGFCRGPETGCPKVRFKDNGDGTVTDNCTGLLWQKETAPRTYLCQQALQYCKDLNLANLTGWRLPNVRELQSLVDYGRSEPAIDPVFGAVRDFYWTSSMNVQNNLGTAWFVRFSDGFVYSTEGGSFYVRAVKDLVAHPADGRVPVANGDVNADGGIDISDSVYLLISLFLGGESPKPIVCPSTVEKGLPDTGQTKCYDNGGAEIDCASADYPDQDGFTRSGCPTEDRFKDNGDGTVTDNCTGLLWQKETVPLTSTWKQALRYCENLHLANRSGWRLPNVRELQSLLDHGLSGPAIHPVFEAVPEFYWSSTTDAQQPTSSWGVHFASGGVFAYDKDSTLGICHVRAVQTILNDYDPD